MPRPTVLLADDHAIVAEGISRLLEDRFELVGIVSDGSALLAAVQEHRPDLIVLDISMPGMSGLEAMRRLKEQAPEARVVFLTMHADAQIAAEALRSGASGFVLKVSAGEELITALEHVLEGRVYLTPRLTGDVLVALDEGALAKAHITHRQLEVLRLMAEGRRMKEIASILGLSTRTIEGYKYEMMSALNVDNTAELIRHAIRHGLILP